MLFAKYAYSAHGYMVDAVDFICGTYIPIQAHQIHGIYVQSGDHFVSGTYMARTYEADVPVCCVLTFTYTNVRSICPHRMRAV